MSNRALLKITGLNELAQAARNYGQAVVEDGKAAIVRAVDSTVRDAKAAAPVDEGELRDSIRGQVNVDAYGATGKVRATARHASFVEFGTEHNDAQPFLLDAASRNRTRMLEQAASSIVRKAPAGLGTPTVRVDRGGAPTFGGDV